MTLDAEGCACCAAKLAAVEAVRALHGRVDYLERAGSLSGDGHILAQTIEALGCPPSLRVPEMVRALRAQVETLTRERDAYRADVATADQVIADLRRERDEAWATQGHTAAALRALDLDAIRAALGPHATGDLVADVRRLVAREDVLRLYLARALRGCDPAERAAIEADLASEEVGDGGE